MTNQTTDASRELLPCPFCGYRNPHLQRQSMAADMCPDETPENERVLWRIGCGQCGAEINCADTREQVVGIWNTRFTQQPMPLSEDEAVALVKKHAGGWLSEKEEEAVRFTIAALTATSIKPTTVSEDDFHEAILFLDHIAYSSGNDKWHDEFLASYKPADWFSARRAVSSFIADKLRALASIKPTSDVETIAYRIPDAFYRHQNGDLYETKQAIHVRNNGTVIHRTYSKNNGVNGYKMLRGENITSNNETIKNVPYEDGSPT